MSIPERDFELYESVLLTEQMPAHQVPNFLNQNPEFKAWYCKRRGLYVDSACNSASVAATGMVAS